MSAELTQLTFRAYEKPEELAQQGQPIGEFSAMFNPESFNIGKKFEFDDSQADSETGSEQKFKKVAPQEFSFDLLIDGTGASGTELDVEREVENFRKITGFSGSERRPAYLVVTFGTINFRAVLKGFDVKFTLHKNDGTPVRAILQVQCCEYKTPEQQLAENPALATTGLTKLRTPEAGATLDLVAHQTYGNSDHLVALAQQNGLNSLRDLPTGDRLELPPADRLVAQAQDQASQLAGQAANQAQRNLTNLF